MPQDQSSSSPLEVGETHLTTGLGVEGAVMPEADSGPTADSEGKADGAVTVESVLTVDNMKLFVAGVRRWLRKLPEGTGIPSVGLRQATPQHVCFLANKDGIPAYFYTSPEAARKDREWGPNAVDVDWCSAYRGVGESWHPRNPRHDQCNSSDSPAPEPFRSRRQRAMTVAVYLEICEEGRNG